MHSFESLEDYSLSLIDKPDSAFPLYWLYDHVEPAVRQATKGELPAAASATLRAALSDAAYLFHLHMNANARVLHDWRALHLNVALLFAEYRIAMHSNRPASKAEERRARWREMTEASLIELYALTGALEELEELHFRGHSILYPRQKDGVTWLVSTAETVVQMHNEAIETAAYPRRPSVKARKSLIDLNAIRVAAAAPTDRLAAELTALARAETLDLMGDHSQVRDVIRSYVTGSSPIQ